MVAIICDCQWCNVGLGFIVSHCVRCGKRIDWTMAMDPTCDNPDCCPPEEAPERTVWVRDRNYLFQNWGIWKRLSPDGPYEEKVIGGLLLNMPPGLTITMSVGDGVPLTDVDFETNSGECWAEYQFRASVKA